MKTQLNKKKTSNTWTTNPKIVNTYINKYIIQRSSPIIEGVDIFDQIGNVNEEYETTSFNSDLLKKLIPQIKNNFTKTDFSVGIKFINLHNVDVWYPNGDLRFEWAPEHDEIYNLWITYFVKSKTRIYFQTIDDWCFILNKKDVELKYEVSDAIK